MLYITIERHKQHVFKCIIEHNFFASMFQERSRGVRHISRNPKIQVIRGVFVPEEDLLKCIEIKGSFISVQYAIEYVLRSRGRKFKNLYWPDILAKKTIKYNMKPRLVEHEEMANRYVKTYGKNYRGWSCKVLIDSISERKYLEFKHFNKYVEPFSVFLDDKEFKKKASTFIRKRKLQHGLFRSSIKK